MHCFWGIYCMYLQIQQSYVLLSAAKQESSHFDSFSPGDLSVYELYGNILLVI